MSKDDKLTSGVNKEAEKLSKEIIKDLQLPDVGLKPIVLLLGGFQGSGKTTVIDILKDELGLVVVSLDEIRQRMFDKGMVVSEEFREIVIVIAMKVFEYLFYKGYSIAWDTNVTPLKIKQVEDFLKSKDLNNYCLVKVYFETSKKELIKRLNQRRDVAGIYRGTLDELEASMKKDKIDDKSVYDLIIDTEKFDAQAVAEQIKTLLGH